MAEQKLDEKTVELIAKAMCYGAERFGDAEADPDEEVCAKNAEYYMQTEWHEYKSYIEHFLRCANVSVT